MTHWETLSVGDGEGSPIAKGKLEDMDVRRVDAVANPATGHRWAIIKSEPDPQRQEALQHALERSRGKSRSESAQLRAEHSVMVAAERSEALGKDRFSEPLFAAPSLLAEVDGRRITSAKPTAKSERAGFANILTQPASTPNDW